MRRGGTEQQEYCYSGLVLILAWRQDGGSVILDPLCPFPAEVKGQRKKPNERRGGKKLLKEKRLSSLL